MALCVGLIASSLPGMAVAADELPIARVVFDASETCVADDGDLVPPSATVQHDDGSVLPYAEMAWTWSGGGLRGAAMTTSDAAGELTLPHAVAPGAPVSWTARVVSAAHRAPIAKADSRRVGDPRSAGQIMRWSFGAQHFRTGAPVSGSGVTRYLVGDGCPTDIPSGTVEIDARLRGTVGVWARLGTAHVSADGSWSSRVAPPDVGSWEVRATVVQSERSASVAAGSRTFEVTPEETFVQDLDPTVGDVRVAGYGAHHLVSWSLEHLSRLPVRPVIDEPRTADLVFVPRGGEPTRVATLAGRTIGGVVTFSARPRVTRGGTFILRYRGTPREQPSSNFRRVYLQTRAKGWPRASKTYERSSKVRRKVQLFDYDGDTIYVQGRHRGQRYERKLKVKRAANGRGSVVVTIPRDNLGRWRYTLAGLAGPTGASPLHAWKVTRR